MSEKCETCKNLKRLQPVGGGLYFRKDGTFKFCRGVSKFAEAKTLELVAKKAVQACKVLGLLEEGE